MTKYIDIKAQLIAVAGGITYVLLPAYLTGTGIFA